MKHDFIIINSKGKIFDKQLLVRQVLTWDSITSTWIVKNVK